MTKFDLYIEKMQERRQTEAENRIDAWLYESVTTREKKEVLAELANGFFFQVKRTVFTQKEAVFS